MVLFSRSGSLLSASISRYVSRRQPVNAVAARVPLSWQPRHGQGNHGHGAAVQAGSGDLEQQRRKVLRKRVDVSVVCQASSRPVEVDPAENDCRDRQLNSQGGFRALSHGQKSIQHLEVKNSGCSSSGVEQDRTYRGLDSNMERRTPCANSENPKGPKGKILACGEQIMQGSSDRLAPGTKCGPNRPEIIIDRKDTDADHIAGSQRKGIVKCAERKDVADEANTEMVNEPSATSALSNVSKGAISEETKDQIEPVDNSKVNVCLDDLPSNCCHDVESPYPVPLSPLSGELAKGIEYKRALVAETAVKAGPAMTRSGVLFEDEWLIVINKPCGVYCEHVLATIPSLLTPAADFSSISRLTIRRPVDNKDTSVPHLHMANRLDRDTSGVMVITKCRNAAGKLSNIFTKRQVEKSYIALCRGPRPSWKCLTVDSGHGRSRYGAWRVYSKNDVGRGLPGGSLVRDMTTHLLVLAINKQLVYDEQVHGSSFVDKLNIEYLVTAGDESSSSILGYRPFEKLDTYAEESSHDSQSSSETDEVVVRAIPLTGRTHQIRLHCQFVGLPLRGDVKYGGPHSVNGVRYDHHALHAESLSFKHPFTFEELHFIAPLPQWATDAGVQPSLV